MLNLKEKNLKNNPIIFILLNFLPILVLSISLTVFFIEFKTKTEDFQKIATIEIDSIKSFLVRN